MIEAPCKGCTRRRIGCHEICEKYAIFKAAKRKYHEKKWEVESLYPINRRKLKTDLLRKEINDRQRRHGHS